MQVQNLYIIGISKSALDQEITKGIKALDKKYSNSNRPNGPSTIRSAHFDIGRFNTAGGLNKKSKSAWAAIASDPIFSPPANAAETAGIYYVFHGGTSDPISATAAANITLKLMGLFNPGNLRKVVLLGCYYGSDFHTGGRPVANFCTTLVLEADGNARPNLPMVAAWDADVYIKTNGRKETKYTTGGQYKAVDATTRDKFKVIATISGSGPNADYALKTYAEAVADWHD